MLEFNTADIDTLKIDALVIPVCRDGRLYTHRTLNALVKQALQQPEFDGGRDQLVTFPDPRGLAAGRIVFMGLGKRGRVDTEALRRMGGRAVKAGIKNKLESICFAVPTPKKLGLATPGLLAAMFEGAFLGNHRFDAYKQEKEFAPLQTIQLWVAAGTARRYARLPVRTEILCTGTLQAREWVSMPSNDKKPEQFAEAIVSKAQQQKLEVTVLTGEELAAEKFGALLAVAAGSRCSPRLVALKYRSRAARRTLVLVGKGVTFDAGGINLKPTASLEDMKMDMSGAAAVAATLLATARVKPKINVVGVMPIVENMPSGDACRPGDIVHSLAGKSVEIGNTDAEGRLILIDAMAWALKVHKPDYLIDVATLTGACVVALGEKIAGLFSPDDELAETVLQAAAHTHERCWRLPLPDDYRELLKSDFADLNNMSRSRWGGAITAALFLSEFVNDTRWAHIDIAGPAYVKKEQPYCAPGGTGFGVRLLCDVIQNIAAGG